MKKHLFLTGPSGVGKTTIIKEALGAQIAYAGGFLTERVTDDSGKLLGFDLLPTAGYERWQILDYSGEKPAKDNEVFRNQGVRLLNEAAYSPFAVLDEIGGFEMLIPQFRNALAVFSYVSFELLITTEEVAPTPPIVNVILSPLFNFTRELA